MAALDVKLAAVLVVALGLAGCVAGPAVDGGTIPVEVLVTRDFGRTLILDATAHVPPNASAMQALTAVADVRTSHGGGFVEAIEGIASRHPEESVDWFFHVDGLAQSVGPRQRQVTAGAIQHWDLHRWDHVIGPGGSLATWPDLLRDRTPAVLGPDRVAEALNGRRVEAPTDGPLVVVGAWNATGLAELSEREHARGFHVHAGPGGFVVHEPTGETAPASDRVRAHVALASNPWGEAGDPVLVVRGRTDADALDAWDAFADRHGRRAHAFVLVDDELREAPS